MINWTDVFHYNDGILYWKINTRGAVAGARAGTDAHRGYRYVGYKGARFLEHRVIWEMFNGPIPQGMVIDHINGKSNRIENLRLATSVQNSANRSRLDKTKTGFKGVYKRKKRFTSKIKDGKKRRFLGSFLTPEEAHAAYVKAAQEIYGEFARP